MAQVDINPAYNLRIGETRSGAPAVLFDFPFDEDLNEAVKALPGRLFDWERRVWVVPIDQPLARQLNEILGRHRNLSVDPEIAEWLEAIDGWEGEVTVDEVGGAPYFAVSTLHGDEPEAFARYERDDQDQILLPFGREAAKLLLDLHGAYLDGSAQSSARAIAAGRSASAATLGVGTDDEGEQRLELELTWGFSIRESFLRLPQAQSSAWDEGSYYSDSDVEVLWIPADAALDPGDRRVAGRAPRRSAWTSRPSRCSTTCARSTRASRRPSSSRARTTRRSRCCGSAASCGRSSAPASSTRCSSGARSSPTSRGSARPCRRSRRSRRPTPIRPSSSARRASS